MKPFAILLVCLIGISPALAVLPRDAGTRRNELLDYRQMKKAEYDRAQQRHEDHLLNKDRQVRSALSLSPWESTSGTVSANKSTGQVSALPEPGSGRSARAWGLSVAVLLLLGGVVWWVRRVTETEPGR